MQLTTHTVTNHLRLTPSVTNPAWEGHFHLISWEALMNMSNEYVHWPVILLNGKRAREDEVNLLD